MSDEFNENTDVEELAKILDDDIQDEADKTETQEESATEAEIKEADDPAPADESNSDRDPDSQRAIPIDLALYSDSTAPTKLSSSLTVQESFPAIDFELKSKQELAVILSELWRHKRNTELVIYYWTGIAINNGREKWTYGDNDMENLADSLGTSSSNLYKASKFAEDYSEEQVKQLLSGKFAMSWRNIAQNLTVPSHEFIKIYGEAESSGEFCNAVTKFKEEANSSKDGSEGSQLIDESQQVEIENTQGQDEDRQDDDGCPVNGEGLDDPDPFLSEDEEGADLESDNETDDPDDNDESTDSESNEPQTQAIDPPEADDVHALTTQIAELEKLIVEKDERIAELEIENAELQKRIQDFEEKQGDSKEPVETIKDIDLAELLSE